MPPPASWQANAVACRGRWRLGSSAILLTRYGGGAFMLRDETIVREFGASGVTCLVLRGPDGRLVGELWNARGSLLSRTPLPLSFSAVDAEGYVRDLAMMGMRARETNAR
jgi:hypothetical protein